MGRSFTLRDAAAFVFFAWVLWAVLPHPARAQGVLAAVPAGTQPPAIAVPLAFGLQGPDDVLSLAATR